MGNSCCSSSCFPGKNTLDFQDKKNTQTLDPNLKELLNHAKKNEDKVIKI